jgi:hypothetical protein
MVDQAVKAVAAGTVSVITNTREWVLNDPYSSTLNVATMEAEQKELEEMFSRAGYNKINF